MHRRRLCTLLTLVGASLLATPAFAQKQPAKPASKPPAAAPTVTPSNPAAKAVLDRAIAEYAKLKSYRDTLQYTFELRGTLGGKDVSEDQTQQPKLAFSREGNKAAITNIPLEFYTDGTSLWVRSPETREYIQRAITADKKWTDTSISGEYADLAHSHPVLEILTGTVRSATGIPGIDTALKVTDDNINGVPAKVVEGRGTTPESPTTTPVFVKAWFNTETSLLMRIQMDLRAMYETTYAAAPSGVKMDIRSAFITLNITEPQINESLNDTLFTFRPGTQEKRVEQFASPVDEDITQPEQLLNRQSPPVQSTLLAGGEFNLADHRGKVVILDFWATWCAPCIRMLPGVNQLAEEYKNKEVVVVGINQDASAAFEKVRKFVSDKALTMPTVLDPGGTIGRSFGANKIPLTVIIDKDGVVRYVHTGFEQDARAFYADKVEKLLRGEKLTP